MEKSSSGIQKINVVTRDSLSVWLIMRMIAKGGKGNRMSFSIVSPKAYILCIPYEHMQSGYQKRENSHHHHHHHCKEDKIMQKAAS